MLSGYYSYKGVVTSPNSHTFILHQVMKTWKDQFTFNFPWDVIVQAAYRKYPNPYNPNVRCLDVLERRVDASRSRLYSHRLFTTLWSVPTLVLTIVGTNPLMHIHEQSECDVKRRTLRIAARNISLTNLFRMDEWLEYQVHPDDPSKTLLVQKARINVHGIPLLGNMLESILINSYSGTVSKGRSAVREKAEQIDSETNTSLIQLDPSLPESSPVHNTA